MKKKTALLLKAHAIVVGFISSSSLSNPFSFCLLFIRLLFSF